MEHRRLPVQGCRIRNRERDADRGARGAGNAVTPAEAAAGPFRRRASCSGRPTSTRRAIATCGRTTSPTSPSRRAESGRRPTKRPRGQATKVARGRTSGLPPERERHRTSRTSPSAPAASRHAIAACTRAASRKPGVGTLFASTEQRHVRTARARFSARRALGRRLARELCRRRGRHARPAGSALVAGDIDARRGRAAASVSRLRKRRASTDVCRSPPAMSSTMGGDVSSSPGGRRRSCTIRSDDDYTSVEAAGAPGAGRPADSRCAGRTDPGHRADDHARRLDRGRLPRDAREARRERGRLPVQGVVPITLSDDA